MEELLCRDQDVKWSKLKMLVEGQFAPAINKRVSIFSTAYGNCGCGRAWLTLDGKEVANFCTRRKANVELGWSDWAVAPPGYGELSRQDAYKACWAIVHDLTIEQALADEDPLVQSLAVLDKRFGKRRQKEFEWKVLHPLARQMFALRLECEGIVRQDAAALDEPLEEYEAVTIEQAEEILTDDLEHCTPQQRALFEAIRIRPKEVFWEATDKLCPTWMAGRIGPWVIWYENVHEAFEIHRPDADGVLRPQSFGMFDLTHILHNLLYEANALAELWEAHQVLEFPSSDDIKSDLLTSLVGLDLAVASLVGSCVENKGKLASDDQKSLNELWQECCSRKSELRFTAGNSYMKQLEFLARIATVTSTPDPSEGMKT